MLAKKNRLTKRKSFNYIYRTGSKYSTPSISLVYIKNNLPDTKIGFVTSKKIGKAHTRNLIKRRMRASVRNNFASISNKYNYIFVAHPSICNLSYQEIDQIIKYLIQKVSKER